MDFSATPGGMSMQKAILAMATICFLGSSSVQAEEKATGNTADDLELYQSYFARKFPGLTLNNFGDGVYAIDKASRDNWQAIEEFPPYESLLEVGEEIWNTPFKNGKGFADCFPEGPAQRKNYPHWSPERKTVITMEMAVNECRESNGEKPFRWLKGPLARLTAYMAYASRGQIIDVKVPSDDQDAVAAYNNGKSIFFARRGQLNFSCAHCHMESAGNYLRSEILGPALGQATNWPTYRSKWGNLGTLHRRFVGCFKLVRARGYEPQGAEYRNLEYFLTHMSNGIQFNGPSSRK